MAGEPKSAVITHSYEENALSRIEPSLVDAAAHLVAESQAPNTRRAYGSSWSAFSAWCEGKTVDPLRATPEIVALYLTDLLAEGLAPVSIARAYSGIADRLRAGQPEWPTGRRPHAVAKVLRGAFRTSGRPPSRKKPILPRHFAELARWQVTTPIEMRNRALLMLGFAGAFRRSELVALDREDLVRDAEGLKITLRRSKTDQEGRGYEKGILPAEDKSVCVIRAVGAWLKCARIRSGPLFRPIRPDGSVSEKRLSAETVADVVKKAVERLGLDPDVYAGHSLRCGFVTSAALQGADLDEIMAQTGHKSVEQVRDYIRRENVFQNNATRGMFDAFAKTTER